MGHRKSQVIAVSAVLLTIAIILDPQTSLNAANEGIELCLRSVMPSLFPFMFLISLLNSSVTGNTHHVFKVIFRPLEIPDGAESLFLCGLLGGYPLGAQNIHKAYSTGKISKKAALRLLGFCNNAGPAFIFGIVGRLFSSPAFSWALWIIHILSAYLTGMILPQKTRETCDFTRKSLNTPSQVLRSSVQALSLICGWVVLFRILIEFFNQWTINIFPKAAIIIVSGCLELVNGCNIAQQISNESLRFIYISAILAFGGGCIWMQTLSVTKELGSGMYLTGKITQTLISVLLSIIYIFSIKRGLLKIVFAIIGIGVLLGLIIWHKMKNNSSQMLKHDIYCC